MTNTFRILLAVIICSLGISFFIPVILQKEIQINNNIENVVPGLAQPKHWIYWNSSVMQAFQQDSNTCRFTAYPAKHINMIELPGKKISISQVGYANYHVEETINNKTQEFVLSIAPYIGNELSEVQQKTIITYAWQSNLLFKLLPFFRGYSFADKTITEFASYLNDANRYYGFPIALKMATDTLFITRKIAINKNVLFTRLPGIFDTLEKYARDHQLKPAERNVAYNYIGNDSVELLAGININKITDGDYMFQFMQMPSNQLLVIADFDGVLSQRQKVYDGIKKYLADHSLMRTGVAFEKYKSALPASDTSRINMQLIFPVRPY